MRIPAFLADRPGEVLVAALLLAALVFGSADRHAAEVAGKASQDRTKITAATRM